jgi:hypothetical protein
MLEKTCSLFIACLLVLSITGGRAAAEASPEKDAQSALKVKAAIAQLGAGQNTRVSLKLRDKTKLSGYISEIGESSFLVTDLKTAAVTTVNYPEVAQIQGNNLSTGVKIAILAAVVVTVIIVLYSVKGAFCDGC